MTDEEKIEGWIEQRGKTTGRRDSDKTKCAMHDYLFSKSDDCFSYIKKTIETEVGKRDHKFEALEHRLENYISKWALGMIVAICTSLLGGMFAMGVWEMRTLSGEMKLVAGSVSELPRIVEDVKEVVKDVDVIKTAVTVIGAKQEGLIDELEKLAPEHKQLMEHYIKANDEGR